MRVKNFAIRVDASSKIGTGHFMRCLTLADALKQGGARTRFISRNLPEHLRSMLAAKGHEFVLLDNNQNDMAVGYLAHAHWLENSQAQDAVDSMQALSDEFWDWLIVDHYGLDFYWESALRQSAKKILVIDDIADRQHDCDILLDQNYYADMDTRYVSLVPKHCQLLLGPHFALLREEFQQLHEQIKPRNGSVRRLMVFFGGIDVDNYTGRTIEALSELDIPDLHVDVVIGAQHPCCEKIESACAIHGFICHVQTDKMAELMMFADLAIGGGGSTTWERCCLGLPTLAICTADNQQKQVADIARKGLLYAPEIKGDLIQSIRRHTCALIENCYLRQFMSHNCMQLVNGRGVSKIIATMGVGDIEIRLARSDDSENLFQWRNHSSIREVSRNTTVINWQDHQNWFTSVMTNSEKILIIGQRSESPIGVVRFDKQNNDAEISIYIVPENAFPGTGGNLLLSAEQWLTANHPDIHKIRAHVLGGNERSQRLFTGAGYQIESTCYVKRLH